MNDNLVLRMDSWLFLLWLVQTEVITTYKNVRNMTYSAFLTIWKCTNQCREFINNAQCCIAMFMVYFYFFIFQIEILYLGSILSSSLLITFNSLCELAYSYGIKYNIYPFVSGLFHLSSLFMVYPYWMSLLVLFRYWVIYCSIPGFLYPLVCERILLSTFWK